MKYIKKFEKSNIKNVWVIPIKMPDFEISLRKIGMNDIDIVRWLQHNRNNIFTDRGKFPNIKTISINKSVDDNVNDYNVFTWFPAEITKSSEYYIFMGKIEITSEEIKEYYDKIEIEKNLKKFNL